MHNYIIGTIIIAIIITQIWVFRHVCKKIADFKCIFPDRKNLNAVKVKINEEETKSITSNTLIHNVKDFQEGSLEISLIESQIQHPILDNIIDSINTYLIRNKGAVSDFHLIKDVVERNCDAEDEQINTLLPIPLYLGLMGTMVGIVVGVGYMALVGFDSFLNMTVAEDGSKNGIEVLMSGVGVAMISSFLGLLLTTLASGFFYKGAKAKIESLKNEFYTFIQTELLPSLSTSAANSIYMLQHNLLKFNEGFTNNIARFDSLLSQILGSFDNQSNLLIEIQKLDVVTLAELNVNVMKELRKSAKEFEQFNQYLQQVNAFVDNAARLNSTLDKQLQKTEHVEEIAAAIWSNVDMNKQLINLLHADLNDIQARKQLVSDAVIVVDDTIRQGLDELKEHTQAKLLAIKEITIKEEDLLGRLLQEDRGNLDELKKLGAVKDSMEHVETATGEQNQKLDELTTSISQQNEKFDELSASIQNLSKILQKKGNVSFIIPNSIKYAGYAFAATGMIAFLAVIIFVISGLFGKVDTTPNTVTRETSATSDTIPKTGTGITHSKTR